jgi:dTDP-4-dehydrorhamnose 3,5-epimerase
VKFEPTEIAGVVRIGLQPHADERGFFARLFCPDEFAAAGCAFAPAQMNLSRNALAGTLRGLHFQAAPHAEAKIVRVTRGAIYDVAVDLRPESPTHRRWIGATLTAEGGDALLIPEGCAHGFLTLTYETDVLYFMDRMFEPGHSQGLRYDDPAIGVRWPSPPRVISGADLAWPPLRAV